jgi:hypothetical protein
LIFELESYPQLKHGIQGGKNNFFNRLMKEENNKFIGLFQDKVFFGQQKGKIFTVKMAR